MKCDRLADVGILALGAFSGARLDYGTGNLTAYGSPAIVADVDPASTTSYTAYAFFALAGVATGNTGGGAANWTSTAEAGLLAPMLAQSLGSGGTSEQTQTPGDYVQFSTSAYAVDITYNQSAYGGIGHVTVDGQPQLAFDSGHTPQPYRLYLDGRQHTVRVTFQGDIVQSVPCVSQPVDVGPAGFASQLGVLANGAAMLAQTYTVYAQTASCYVLNQAGTNLGTVLAGTSSASVVPGVTLTLSGSKAWPAGGVATFSTHPATLVLGGIALSTALLPTATWTSPVFDSGNLQEEWPLLELVAGPAAGTLPSATAYVGPNATPDSTWASAPMTPASYADVTGADQNIVAYANTSGLRGQFCQLVLSIPSTIAREWAADLRLFHWQPETDPFYARFTKQNYKQGNLRQLVLALAAAEARLLAQTRETLAGVAISTAKLGALAAAGQTLRLPRRRGETDAQYRARLLNFNSTRQFGGSTPFLTSVLSAYAGVQVQVSAAQRTLAQWTLPAGVLGQSTILGSSLQGAWQWTARVPFSGLLVPPESFLAFVGTLRPVGSVVTVVWV